MRYQKEIDAALKAGNDVRGIYAKRDAEILATTTQFQNKRLEESKRAEEQAAKEKADTEKRLADEIEELKIKATKSGIDQQLALNEVARRKAIEDAKRLGIDLAAVNQKYDLIAQGIKGGEVATSPIPSRGTFNNRELADFGAGSQVQTILKQIAEHSESTSKGVVVVATNTKRTADGFGF